MMRIVAALFSLLTTNLVFTRALGTSTLMAATKNRSSLPVLALLMTVFSTLTCFVTALLYHYAGLGALRRQPYDLALPLVYTAVTSVIYCIVLLLLYVLLRRHFSACKKYVHLAAFNCAVMGTLYLTFGNTAEISVYGAVRYGLLEGLGFVLAALMLWAVRKRLYDREVPAAFRGFPAVMVYIGLISMAVYAVFASG